MNTQHQRLLTAAQELLAWAESQDCVFWACQGPDVRPVSMITCSKCQQVHEIRATIGELTGTPYNTNDLPHMHSDRPGPRWRVGVYTVKSRKEAML